MHLIRLLSGLQKILLPALSIALAIALFGVIMVAFAEINCNLTLTKSPSVQYIAMGGTATFTLTLTNNLANEELRNITVTDYRVSDGLNLTSYCVFPEGNGNITLARNGYTGYSKSYTCSVPNVLASFQNHYKITGQYRVYSSGHWGSWNNFGEYWSNKVWVYLAAIDIQKTPDAQYIITNGTANFHIKVTNTSPTITLDNVTVTDALAPNCNNSTIGSLAPGASAEYDCSLAGISADMTNVAVATGAVHGSSPTAYVTDQDDAMVFVEDPILTVIIDNDPEHFRDFQFTTASNGTPLTSPFYLDDEDQCLAEGSNPTSDVGEGYCTPLDGSSDTNQPETITFQPLVSGIYTVTELIPNGNWNLDPSFGYINCTGSLIQQGTSYALAYDKVVADPFVSGYVAVPLGANQHVTCTFYNMSSTPTAIKVDEMTARPLHSSTLWMGISLIGFSALGIWFAWRRKDATQGSTR